ncbi:MAG TPA: 1-deoxy-D-xylulose-5-phosphate reductoisomerase [Acidimicrobiales bacterium]|nr:1-deoxy-D-xylulose-5-phosphate reductoisomerase [Acidimicrobiales bacterium]
MTDVAVLGSTGSIGTQTLDVIAQHREQFDVVALAAGTASAELVEQVRKWRPALVAVADEAAGASLRDAVPPGTRVICGADGLSEAGAAGEVAVNAVVGFAGLPVTIAALSAGHRLALANKESLIAAGPVVAKARATEGAEIIPVDSEHCAVHQCLRSGSRGEVERLVLTASGGPFRGRNASDLRDVTIADALAHPTWAMGPKITVDSSTLVNKGLEVIEAHELFGLPYDRIDVVVHPQSIVHSMVSFTDGATIAQLSQPDMRLPIGYALGYPSRLATPFGALSWDEATSLDFEPPDREAFPGLDLAYAAGRAGGVAPAWLSAANEVAVEAFLDGRLRWIEIAEVIAEVLAAAPTEMPATVADVLNADSEARRRAAKAVSLRAAA